MSITPETKYLTIIGSSAGGPRILREIFDHLPHLNGSIIVIQHMPAFINESVCRTLNTCTDMTVKVAEDGEFLRNGTVYIAPSEVHLYLLENERIRLKKGEKVNWVCPSIDVTMKSLIRKPYHKFMGIVLTGMGRDGADGLVYMKSIGAITVAQDAETSIVNGMPKEAAQTGRVDFVLTPDQIKNKLMAELGY